METMDGHQELLSMSESKQEYWGPVSKDFTDAYLDVIYENLKKSPFLKRKHKKVFSTVTEMLHNITQYNIKHYKEGIPPSYISIELLNNTTVLRFYNMILLATVDSLKNTFTSLTNTKKEDFSRLCKRSILNNESLGLQLLNRDEDTNFHWEFMKDKGKNWLKILITVNHGSTYN